MQVRVLIQLLAVIGCTYAADPVLEVQARTGIFVGDLNDTYPDVRQFNYVPYGKVGHPPPL